MSAPSLTDMASRRREEECERTSARADATAWCAGINACRKRTAFTALERSWAQLPQTHSKVLVREHEPAQSEQEIVEIGDTSPG